MTGSTLKPINPDIKCDDIPDMLDFATKGIVNSVTSARDEFIKQKLTEKGYERLANEMKYRRFPEMSIVSHDEWQYIFVDDGTVQGDFIGAIRITTDAFNPLSPTEIRFGIDWQDADFEAVRIPEI